ncbi:MAG TPA: hypothetical protein VF059_07950 [Casimicrobiaceae bacterium]
MTIRLASASLVETAVTLAAAALMTLAGFEMLQGISASAEAALAGGVRPADPAPPRHAGSPASRKIALPHVDQSTA